MRGLSLGPWRRLDLLVVALPAALAARLLDAGAAVLFILSALAVIPLAGLVGRATEVLAETVGGSKGALLNATFGNMAELMIAALLVLNGEIAVLKASITGSIIGNLLLLLGVAMIVAGRGKDEVRITATSQVQSTMLFLSIGILLLPTVFSFRPESTTTRLDEVSWLVALTLFVVYALSLLFMLRTNRSLFRTESPAEGHSGPADHRKTWSVKGAVGAGRRHCPRRDRRGVRRGQRAGGRSLAGPAQRLHRVRHPAARGQRGRTIQCADPGRQGQTRNGRGDRRRRQHAAGHARGSRPGAARRGHRQPVRPGIQSPRADGTDGRHPPDSPAPRRRKDQLARRRDAARPLLRLRRCRLLRGDLSKPVDPAGPVTARL